MVTEKPNRAQADLIVSIGPIAKSVGAAIHDMDTSLSHHNFPHISFVRRRESQAPKTQSSHVSRLLTFLDARAERIAYIIWDTTGSTELLASGEPPEARTHLSATVDGICRFVNFMRSRKLLDRSLHVYAATEESETQDGAPGESLGASLLAETLFASDFPTANVGHPQSVGSVAIKLSNSDADSAAQGHGPLGWDRLVDPWIDSIPVKQAKVPSAYRIWKSSRRYFLGGDLERAQLAENLNYLLHNSYVPFTLDLEEEITFGYGGIGVVVHKDAKIDQGVTIGANVTIGSKGKPIRVDSAGRPSTVPKIGAYTYIGTGSKVLGGIDVGALSILGPNTVLMSDTPPGSVVVGAPARIIQTYTVEQAVRNQGKFLSARSMDKDDFRLLAEKHLQRS